MLFTHLWSMQQDRGLRGLKINRIFGLIAFGFLIGTINAPAEGHVLNWVKKAGGQFSDAGNAIVLDDGGNSYVTGTFLGPAIFGEADNEVLLPSDKRGAYLAKYDHNGNLIWVKMAPSTQSAAGIVISLDLENKVYVGGNFAGTMTLGEGENKITLNGIGGQETFLAKFDQDGNLLWAIQTINTHFHNFDQIRGLAIDKENNSYVTGYYRGATTFGEGANAITLISNGFGDFYLAKYDSDGNLLWVNSSGGDFADSGSSVVVDENSNIFVTGLFTSTSITFGEGVDAITLIGSRLGDTFVAKYDTNGRLIWVKQAIDVGGNDIVLDKSGNSLVTGFFERTATFGEGENLTTLVSNNGSRDFFLAKYDGNGELMWVRSGGGPSSDHGSQIEIDVNDNVHVLGQFIGPVAFGQGEDAVLFPGSGNIDVLLVTYDSSGGMKDIDIVGSGFSIIGRDLALDLAGNRTVVGQFREATFGEAPEAVLLTSAGVSDMFLAKYIDRLLLSIDIWPNRLPNIINLRSRMIPVTVYSSAEFDATLVIERESLTFGPQGDNESLIYRGALNLPSCQVRDINSDGFVDLQCFFATGLAGFQPGDTEGILKGLTINGTPIEGKDSVEITSGNR